MHVCRRRHIEALERREEEDDEEGGHQVNRATRLDRPFEYRSADKMDSSIVITKCARAAATENSLRPALYSLDAMGVRVGRFKTYIWHFPCFFSEEMLRTLSLIC